MADPVVFLNTSPRFNLPLLYSGQSQKEVYVNEAHALMDALMHCVIDGSAAQEPTSPENGTTWLVEDGATGRWEGHDGALACWQNDNWLFVTPRDGLRILDRQTGQTRTYLQGWRIAETPGTPTGGTVIDAEARTAIAALIAALKVAGVFAE